MNEQRILQQVVLADQEISRRLLQVYDIFKMFDRKQQNPQELRPAVPDKNNKATR